MTGIFCNRASGNGKGLKMARELLARMGPDAVLYDTNWPQSLEGLKEAWIVGGDGTVCFFLNRYPDHSLPVMIFPGGTGNDIHWKLYGSQDVDAQFEQRTSYKTVPVDRWLCNGRAFVNGVGLGFDGEVLRSMQTIRLLGGHWGYLLVVIRQILSFREPKFRITSEGQTTEARFMLLSLANSSRTGGGFHVSPLADLHDGLLDMVRCQPLSVWKRLQVLPLVEKGTHLKLPFVEHSRVSEVLVETDEEIYGQLDGELIRGCRFELQKSAAPLWVRCPDGPQRSA